MKSVFKSTQLACVCAAFVCGSVVIYFLPSFAARKPTAASPPMVLDPRDPSYEEVLCGPVSLSIALGRIGIGYAVDDLAAKCDVTADGVLFSDLERVAKTLPGISAKLERLNWGNLRELDGVAVLFVGGNHFVAVDTREVPPGDATPTAARIRVYQPGHPAEWWDQEKLEQQWSGSTLVVRKTAETGAVDAPRIEWREVIGDHGVLKSGASEVYRFSFRNAGQKELSVAGGRASCTCVDHSFSQQTFAPGESGYIEVTVDLGHAFGYLRQYLVVESNDPQYPESVLTMAAGVARAQVTSSEHIGVKDIPQGSSASVEFYVADPGFSGVKIRDASTSVHAESDLGKNLTVVLTHDLVGDDAVPISQRTAFRVQPKDHVVTLKIETTDLCPPGPFECEVDLVLEADIGVMRKKVVLNGLIAPDVVSVPPVAVIVLNDDRRGTANVGFRSHSGKSSTIKKAWSDSEDLLKIAPADNIQGPKYLITAVDREMVPGTAPVKRTAFFQLENGSVVTVPVAVYCPVK